MSQPVHEGANRLNFTATTTITPTSGYGVGNHLLGVFVAQASSTPTLKVADTVGNIANTFIPSQGTFYPMPCDFSGTLTITVGGTVDATVFWMNG